MDGPRLPAHRTRCSDSAGTSGWQGTGQERVSAGAPTSIDWPPNIGGISCRQRPFNHSSTENRKRRWAVLAGVAALVLTWLLGRRRTMRRLPRRRRGGKDLLDEFRRCWRCRHEGRRRVRRHLHWLGNGGDLGWNNRIGGSGGNERRRCGGPRRGHCRRAGGYRRNRGHVDRRGRDRRGHRGSERPWRQRGGIHRAWRRQRCGRRGEPELARSAGGVAGAAGSSAGGGGSAGVIAGRSGAGGGAGAAGVSGAGGGVAGAGGAGGGGPLVLSIDFIGGDTNGAAPMMDPTEVAGARPAAHWNGAADIMGALANLVQADGASTTAAVTWNSPKTGSAYGMWRNPFPDAPGDVRMMNGYLDPGTVASPAVVTVNGLPTVVHRARLRCLCLRAGRHLLGRHPHVPVRDREHVRHRFPDRTGSVDLAAVLTGAPGRRVRQLCGLQEPKERVLHPDGHPRHAAPPCARRSTEFKSSPPPAPDSGDGRWAAASYWITKQFAAQLKRRGGARPGSRRSSSLTGPPDAGLLRTTHRARPTPHDHLERNMPHKLLTAQQGRMLIW